MPTLFDCPENEQKKEWFQQYKCKHCTHCQKWQCGTKFIFYCGKRKSNRTENGKLKIKANQEACAAFIKD